MDEIPEGLPPYFEPIRRLGEGGMGVVWSVRDKKTDRMGALKVIRQKPGMSPLALTRFEREIRNFAQLVHPYIVQVYDVGQMRTGDPYILMEQVNGRPVCTEMLRRRSFSEVMMLLDRVLEGLGEAHAHNLIHRDLKPDNILVTEDSEGRLMPKLMDFGLALRADENDMRITSDGMVVGTPVYMAPEQACDEHYQICPATDFYGIGCILYELFCGEPPFKGANAVMVMVAQAKEMPPAFHPLPYFPEAARLRPIIERLLEKMPDKRYETAADFRAALREYHLIEDGVTFGVQRFRSVEETLFDERKEEEGPFFSTDLGPRSYRTILPELVHAKYNYSVLSLRPPEFVGRSCALHIMERYLRDVYQCRRMAVMLITGRPGVGKSRFFEVFAQDCYRHGCATSLVVDGSVCANLRFSIFRALFGRLLLKTLTENQVVLALCRFLQTEDEHDFRVEALRKIFEAEMAQSVPSFEMMDCVFGVVFERLTKDRPLLLCVDNLDPKQRMELCDIARELTEYSRVRLPILLCVVNTTVNEMPTDLELSLGNEGTLWLRHSLTIEPLSNADMHLLTTRSLGMSEALAFFIDNLSSGLPQIAVDLARQWHLAGFLEHARDGYHSVRPVETLPIPRVVHEAILCQITLTFSDYPLRTWSPVASLAAACGESFTPTLLSCAIRHIPTSQKLISPSTFISLSLSGGVLKTLDATTLSFKHKLMQDALIAMLQDYEVQDYHRAIALARREFSPSPANDREIARHLLLAHQYYDAFHVCRNLARQCVLCGNDGEASRYIEQAQDALMQHLGFIDARTPEIVDIWVIQAEIALNMNRVEQAVQRLQWLDYAQQFCEEPERRAAYFVLKARMLSREGEVQRESVLSFLDEALRLLSAITPPLSPEQLAIQFQVYAARFPYDASVAPHLIETARALHNLVYVGKVFLAFARSALSNHDTTRAVRILNMAIDTAHQNGDTRTESEGLLLLSQTQSGQSEVRLKTLFDAMRCFEKLGDFKGLSQIHFEISDLLASSSPDEARIHAHWGDLLCASSHGVDTKVSPKG
ncbi:MAG: protein kinase [Bradymonadia bacterium]